MINAFRAYRRWLADRVFSDSIWPNFPLIVSPVIGTSVFFSSFLEGNQIGLILGIVTLTPGVVIWSLIAIAGFSWFIEALYETTYSTIAIGRVETRFDSCPHKMDDGIEHICAQSELKKAYDYFECRDMGLCGKCEFYTMSVEDAAHEIVCRRRATKRVNEYQEAPINLRAAIRNVEKAFDELELI